MGKVCNAISQAVQRWGATNVSVPLKVKGIERMRIERRAAPTKDGRVVEFQEPFVADLSHAVSAFGVDLWLDGSCLRGRVRDVFKTTVEAVLDTEMNEHYADLLPNGPNPAAGPSPVAATSVAARCP
ncbi:unnamed protein product, partial [Ectocarpus fasciculatus]